MPGDNDVQRVLGRLQASDEASQRQRAELFSQVGEIKETLGEIKVLVSPLARHIEDDNDRFQSHGKRLTELEAGHNKVRGAMWAAGVMGGLGGFLASKLSALAGFIK